MPWIDEGGDDGREDESSFGVAITGKVLDFIKKRKKLTQYVLPEILQRT
jgi:hypothetical protein